MRLPRFPIARLLIASALVLTASCGVARDPAVRFIPDAAVPAEHLKREPRPPFPAIAAKSEAAYEQWVSDIDDWGKRSDVRLWAGCRFLNTFLEHPRECGAKPEGAAAE